MTRNNSNKCTGVCPFDRSVIQAPGMKGKEFSSFKPESLAQRSGLAYIPLYSPARATSLKTSTPSKFQNVHPARALQQSPPNFSYSDPCLNETSLLEMTTSEDLSSSPFETSFSVPSAVPLRRATSVSNFLIPPLPPSKIPTKHGKSSGTVLTSIENRQMMEEKERKKAAEAQKKEERKKAREEKARRVAKQKEEKMQRKKKKGMSLYFFFLVRLFSYSSTRTCRFEKWWCVWRQW